MANIDNYRLWFKGPIERLYADGDGGFAILVLTIPLLERYLREKSGVHEGNLNDAFYDEFLALFPKLGSRAVANEFWQVYRNGLLHQVTLSKAYRNGIGVRPGWIAAQNDAIAVDAGRFICDPRCFAVTVLARIEADFAVFEGPGSVNHPPAQIVAIPVAPAPAATAPVTPIVIRGTGTP